MLTKHSFSYASLELPATDAARVLFSRLASQTWAMLLESANQHHPDSRFHIISAEPLATLETHDMTTTIRRAQNLDYSQADPLTLLAQIQTELLGASIDDEDETLPFTGGAMGLWGYDLGRRFEELPSLAKQDLQLADMAIGIYDWAWILDNANAEATLLVVGNEEAWQQRWRWWNNQKQQIEPDFQLCSEWLSNMSKDEYATRFSAIQEYLRAGDCYQINLTQRFCADYTGDEWQAYCQLSSRNAGPFSAFLRLPQSCVLSFSPERFLLLDGRVISSKPIKGTRPRGTTKEADAHNAHELQCAPKDRAENLMIVDLLRNDIGRVSQPGSVSVPQLFAIESFPAVHHLVSTITGVLSSDYSATDLLRACFPGGSITGAPKVRAMEIIEELEPHRRNAYCGAIGYISHHGRMDTNIAIRTIIAENNKLYVWAGGGIVADSRVDDEYAETFHKLAKILSLEQRVIDHG